MADHIEKILSKHRINCLYHITDKDNLFSIVKHGLKSHDIAHGKYCPTDIANPEVNQRRSDIMIGDKPLHEYVPLYFAPKNPMSSKRRDSKLAILHVDREVIRKPNVIFTDGNAASSYTIFFNDINDLDKLDWKCLKAQYWSDFIDGTRKRCAEVLVPHEINLNYIKEISVKNERIRNELIEFLPVNDEEYDDEKEFRTSIDDTFYGIPLKVTPDFFF